MRRETQKKIVVKNETNLGRGRPTTMEDEKTLNSAESRRGTWGLF